MGKKEKKPKKVEYAPVKATMYAIMYFVIYIIVPYISTTSIEAILPWINFDLLPLPFIFIAGTGIIVMGFIAVYLEPVQPAPSAVLRKRVLVQKPQVEPPKRPFVFSSDPLVNAVIMSEILQPPISMRMAEGGGRLAE